MRTLLNIIWLVLSGLWLFLGYALAAAIMCVLIVTIPWGIAAWRVGVYALWPFGKTVVDRPTAGVGSAIGNVVWVVLAGWWLALGHIASALALAITIIGIPFAWANLKMLPVALLPLGKQIVDQP
ncbi:YccF domain-containing protein [Microcella alkalica]|uniref:YccF domain-containing protein n=1 Tax=Microcella alkalica TaxID=355930 RepID=UPI00145CEFE7|nr:YccF domain-containing protein [Microcella alkalica]